MSVSTPPTIGLIGKDGRNEDFTVLRSATGSSSEVEARVLEGLQIHLKTDGTLSVFVFELNGVWVARADNQKGSDASGRRRARAEFVLAPPGDRVEQLALGLAAPLSDHSLDPVGLEPQPVDDGVGAREALLELVMGGKVAAVKTLAEAAWVMRQWGADPSLTLLHCEERVPTRPLGENMLVVSSAIWLPSDAARSFAALNVPNIEGLRRVQELGARERLLRIWRDQTPPPADITAEPALRWMLQAGHHRSAVLARATPEARRLWLEDQLLTVSEAAEIRWRPSDYRALAALYSAVPRSWHHLARIHDVDGELLAAAMDQDCHNTFDWVRTGCVGPTPANAAQHLAELGEGGALGRLPSNVLSEAARRTNSHPVRTAWVEMMVGRGLPREVALALSTDGTLAAAPHVSPAPRPDANWLQAVASDALLQAGVWASAQTAWRKWWEEALAERPDVQQVSIHGEYGEVAVAWLVGAVRDREVSAPAALATLKRWGQSASPSQRDIQTILDACGYTPASMWVTAMSGARLPTNAPSPAEAAIARSLVDADLLSRDTIVDAVITGADLNWLAAFAAPEAVALLSVQRIPPQVPPSWDERLDRLLAMQTARPEFWARWFGDGIGMVLASWIAERVAPFEGGVRTHQLALAIRGETRLDRGTLAVVVGALSPLARVRQVALWGGEDRQKQMEIWSTLRADGAFSPAAFWLMDRLSTWRYGAVPQDLTCRELVVLLPWLDPAAVIRLVMERQQRDPNENELLDVLIVRLRDGASLPAPVPPAGAAALRPDWVARLSEIPSWQHWKNIAELALLEREDGRNVES